MKITKYLGAPTGIALALVLASCSSNLFGGHLGNNSGQTVHVTMEDDSCKTDSASIPAGKVTFEIKNNGSTPNEFEVLSEDKLKIESEKENIGPGSFASLTTSLKEGIYFTACKPNMVGDFVGLTKFEVTPGQVGEETEDQKGAEKKAVQNYTSYVKDQVGQLVKATQDFIDAYVDGNIQSARELYPLARQYYERIEPTAGSFGIDGTGDLAQALDLRLQERLSQPGDKPWSPQRLDGWTGWHRIEADLYSAPNSPFSFGSQLERQAAADQLEDSTHKLYDLVYGKIKGSDGKFKLELTEITSGAAELLKEVANAKIAGGEETFSHTDLYNFKANIEGAEVVYGNVEDIIKAKDKTLAEQVEKGFKAVNDILQRHTDGTTSDGKVKYVDYRSIAEAQEEAGEVPQPGDYTAEQKELSGAINALSGLMSRVAGVIR